MEQNTSNKKSVEFKRQPLVIYLLSSFSFLLILFRLVFLQILSFDSYKNMSDENRIRLIATQPIRGRILDKNGLVLADSRVKYSLIIKPQYVNDSDLEKNKSKISYLLGEDIGLMQSEYSRGIQNGDFAITLIDDLNVDQVIKFKENENSLAGFEIAKKILSSMSSLFLIFLLI